MKNLVQFRAILPMFFSLGFSNAVHGEGISVKMVRDELIASCGEKMKKADIKSLITWENRTPWDRTNPVTRLKLEGQVRITLNGLKANGYFQVMLQRVDAFEDIWVRVDDFAEGGAGFKTWNNEDLIKKFDCDPEEMSTLNNDDLKKNQYKIIFTNGSIANF